MRFLKNIKSVMKKAEELNWFSKLAVKMGALMMLSFYITGAVSKMIAAHVPNYLGAISVFRGCMEAAPASLVSGICAAVICDLALRDRES